MSQPDTTDSSPAFGAAHKGDQSLPVQSAQACLVRPCDDTRPCAGRPRKKSPDPTHLRSVDGPERQPQPPPETFPLKPERPTKPTIRAAKSCRLQQRPA